MDLKPSTVPQDLKIFATGEATHYFNYRIGKKQYRILVSNPGTEETANERTWPEVDTDGAEAAHLFISLALSLPADTPGLLTTVKDMLRVYETVKRNAASFNEQNEY